MAMAALAAVPAVVGTERRTAPSRSQASALCSARPAAAVSAAACTPFIAGDVSAGKGARLGIQGKGSRTSARASRLSIQTSASASASSAPAAVQVRTIRSHPVCPNCMPNHLGPLHCADARDINRCARVIVVSCDPRTDSPNTSATLAARRGREARPGCHLHRRWPHRPLRHPLPGRRVHAGAPCTAFLPGPAPPHGYRPGGSIFPVCTAVWRPSWAPQRQPPGPLAPRPRANGRRVLPLTPPPHRRRRRPPGVATARHLPEHDHRPGPRAAPRRRVVLPWPHHRGAQPPPTRAPCSARLLLCFLTP